MTFPDLQVIMYIIVKFDVSTCPRSYFTGLLKHLPPNESFISLIL